MSFSYQLIKTDGQARAGILHTAHGDVQTPVFMPVGTRATVKTVSPDELEELGSEIILANTYHLYLRPGEKLIEKAGGLHEFMAWHHPILTDSGGFQVFSLSGLRKISDDGVLFSSHIDGSRHLFTPEKVMDIEGSLGSDIAMCLDECSPWPADEAVVEQALKRTTIWARRCREYHNHPYQALFGIVQGGTFRHLRERSTRELLALDFPGYGIGGLSVGEPKEIMYEVLDYSVPWLPVMKPRYLMGVGSPDCLLEAVDRGVDMCDCVLPTRIARNGTVFTHSGPLVVRNAAYADDFSPLEEGCKCYACRHFSRAYIRHLLNVGEVLGIRLTTIHNLYFLLNLMHNAREAILNSNFADFKKEFLVKYNRQS